MDAEAQPNPVDRELRGIMIDLEVDTAPVGAERDRGYLSHPGRPAPGSGQRCRKT
jgi:hypothetical protein